MVLRSVIIWWVVCLSLFLMSWSLVRFRLSSYPTIMMHGHMNLKFVRIQIYDVSEIILMGSHKIRKKSIFEENNY